MNWTKIWSWIKSNPWRAAVYPLLAAVAVMIWAFRGGQHRIIDSPLINSDEEALKALRLKQQAIESYRAALAEAEKKARERLSKASQEQLEEYQKMKGKPVEEIARWIDNLS